MSPLWVWSEADGQASFRVDERDGCAVIAASGEIDIATAPALGEAVDTAAKVSRRIVVDLAAVAFIDLHGFSTLLSGQRRHASQRSVSLARPAPMVRKVVRMARLDEVFPIYETLRDAMECTDPQSDAS
jgi:anti-sigma B factor antagonist